MKIILRLLFLFILITPLELYAEQKPINFVVQLTRTDDNFGHRRVFLQIDKVLNDIGEGKLNIEVVAYENGIHALLANNKKTSQLLTKLANRGVTFKACEISIRAWDLDKKDFPLEVEFVPTGATEMIRLQMLDYKYWRQ